MKGTFESLTNRTMKHVRGLIWNLWVTESLLLFFYTSSMQQSVIFKTSWHKPDTGKISAVMSKAKHTLLPYTMTLTWPDLFTYNQIESVSRIKPHYFAWPNEFYTLYMYLESSPVDKAHILYRTLIYVFILHLSSAHLHSPTLNNHTNKLQNVVLLTA